MARDARHSLTGRGAPRLERILRKRAGGGPAGTAANGQGSTPRAATTRGRPSASPRASNDARDARTGDPSPDQHQPPASLTHPARTTGLRPEPDCKPTARQMADRRSPNDRYRRLIDALAPVARLTFVTTSVVATLATAVALVTIVVMLILSI